MADSRHRGRSSSRLERAALDGTFYRLTAEEWSDSLGITKQRFHQIRSELGLATRRVAIHKALTERLSWKARSQALWRVGIFNRRGDCWETLHTYSNLSGSLYSALSGLEGDKRRIFYLLRYGHLPSMCIFQRPTCGHRWCIDPEHQRPVGAGPLLHRLALPRSERIAAALEAGKRQTEIARREGVSPDYVSKVNLGLRGRGVRKKYPIRATLKNRSPK